MKVIDLLNKIANGEEVPKKITIQNDTLFYNKDHLLYLQDYYYMEDEEGATWKIWSYGLNDEVEIIEDNKIPTLKDLNLTKIDINNEGQVYKVTKKEMIADIQTLQNWINEIIDYINEEK